MAISVPVNKEGGLARNGVQTLECIDKDILNTAKTSGNAEHWGGREGSGPSVQTADSPHRAFPERGSPTTRTWRGKQGKAVSHVAPAQCEDNGERLLVSYGGGSYSNPARFSCVFPSAWGQLLMCVGQGLPCWWWSMP